EEIESPALGCFVDRCLHRRVLELERPERVAARGPTHRQGYPPPQHRESTGRSAPHVMNSDAKLPKRLQSPTVSWARAGEGNEHDVVAAGQCLDLAEDDQCAAGRRGG